MLDMDPKMQKLVNEVRQYIAKKYDFNTLYQWTITSGTASVPRRFETPALKEYSRKKFEAWREGIFVDHPLDGQDGRSF